MTEFDAMNDDLNDDLREMLSALADDELPPARRRRLLDRVLADSGSRDELARIFLIGEALRKGLPADPPVDLRRRIRIALDAEPVPLPKRARPRLRLPPIAGVALAATVALVAVIVGGDWMKTEPAADSAMAVPAGVETAQMSRWDTRKPAVEARLKNYLVSHSEYLGRGLQGMHPYARVIAYDASR